MNNFKPLISIITVVYNNVSTLEQTILSVLNQSYTNYEYIIIDGGSTDGSIEVIKRYADKLAYWISEKDEGMYFAINKGLSKSNGELIGIINSDDWYEPKSFANIVDVYNNKPAYDIYHGLVRYVSKSSKVQVIIGHHHSFLTNGMIEHPACFVKRHVYTSLSGFSTGYKSASDYDLMLRARAFGFKFILIELIIASFRIGGMSGEKIAIMENLELKRKHKLISIYRYFCWKIFLKLKYIIN